MSFYNEPGFWAFLTAMVGATRWLSRVIYLYAVRANEQKAKLSMSIESFKEDNIQKSIDCFNGFMTRIEPLTAEIKPLMAKQETMIRQLDEALEIIGVIDRGFHTMSGDLVKKYDEFQRKIQNITISFQTTIDRVDAFDKKLSALGKVIVKP